MSPQIPNIAVIASSVVVLLGLIGVNLLPADVEKVANAALVLLITAGGIWSWVQTKFMSNQISQMKAQMTNSVKVAKVAVIKGKKAKKK